MMGYPRPGADADLRRAGDRMGCMFAAVGCHARGARAPAMTGRPTRRRLDAGMRHDGAGERGADLRFRRTRAHALAGSQRYAGNGLFECSDGYVYLFAGGMGASRFWAQPRQWLRDERMPGSEMPHHARVVATRATSNGRSQGNASTNSSRFAITRTKDQLYHEGQARRIPLCPVNDPESGRREPATPLSAISSAGFRIRVSVKQVVMPGTPYAHVANAGRVAARSASARRAQRREFSARCMSHAA